MTLLELATRASAIASGPVQGTPDLAAEGIELEQFRMGLGLELEHGRVDQETDVEIPDSYARLAEMEAVAEA